MSWFAYPTADDRTVAEFNALSGTNDQTISGNVAQTALLCPFRKA